MTTRAWQVMARDYGKATVIVKTVVVMMERQGRLTLVGLAAVFEAKLAQH
jgi:hypothetical protein